MIPSLKFQARLSAIVMLCLSLLSFSTLAYADDDSPLSDGTIQDNSGGAGLGLAMRFENSPYRGGGTRNDLVPIYAYEGKHVFLESYRIGLKLDETDGSRFDVFFSYRFEGYPYDHIPAVLNGLSDRNAGADLGFGYHYKQPWGTVFGELLHDVASGSHGTEVRIGYRNDWELGKFKLQPQIVLAARDARLNNYYYGVRPGEATSERPAYAPGGGVNVEIGMGAAYPISERWRLVTDLSAKYWSSGVRSSPIVEDRTQLAGTVGLAYDFSPKHDAWPEGRPLIVKVLYGKSTACDLPDIIRLTCLPTKTTDNTKISGIELGRPFIEHLNGWPLDFVGYIGVLRHDENGLQHDSWQVNADMKAYYYGFPWSNYVRTRIGFGVGISYAQRVPYNELKEQMARHGRTSRLLNYLDPTIDVSTGDLFGMQPLRDTYLGVGISHRSGIFGTSRLLGNASGGSNFVYSYLEWRM